MPEWVVKYWIEWVFGLIIAGLGWAVKHLAGKVKAERAAREALEEQQKQETEAIKDGMKSLLRRQILEDCKRVSADGYCGATMRDTITAMYEAYTALGGNGTVKDAVTEVRELPMNRRES